MSSVLATSDTGMVSTFEPALSISAFVRLSPGPVLSPASRAWMLSSAACNAFNFVNDWSPRQRRFRRYVQPHCIH